MTKNTKKLTPGGAILNIVLWLVSIGFLYSVIWLFYSAMKTKTEFNLNSIALPKHPTLDNFKNVFTITNIPLYMGNSFLVTAVAIVGILLISFVMGYFLSRFDFKGKTTIFTVLLIGMLIPQHSLMVPITIIFTKLGLTDHRLTLVLPYIAFQLPIGVYLVESYVRSIPKEMEEAAAIDGASFNYTLFNIILRMTTPVLSTVAIISFFACWNEFIFALILTTKSNLRTLQLGLTAFKGSYSANYPMIMASMFIGILPALILFVFGSKKIMDGMVVGAVKG